MANVLWLMMSCFMTSCAITVCCWEVNPTVTRSKAAHSVSQDDEDQSDSICALCSGSYEDDIGSDGCLLKEWVKCTAPECKLWMHEECAEREDQDQMVCVCGNVFK